MTTHININYSLEKIDFIAKQIIKKVPNKTLLFYGAMGVGKTTLIKAICKELNIKDAVHSPTFSLVNEYRTTKNETVYHFDFYRIKNEQEAYDIGIEEYLYSNNWCFIEWAENIKPLIPLESVAINMSLLKNGKRNIQLNTTI